MPHPDPPLPRSAALQTMEAQAQMLACDRRWVNEVAFESFSYS